MSTKLHTLYIPTKIHVGFQNRQDTYTKKLGYVIYEDEKGVLRKKTSWSSWRDNKIEPQIFDNTPARFVLNKGIQRHGYFGSGRSIVRVYDTRDFEFEISIDNLIGILMHSDVSKRDIVEECVFAWYGPELILLPVNSEEYTSSVQYTSKQSQKVSARELVAGRTYAAKRHAHALIYMGFHPIYDTKSRWSSETLFKGKKHVFYNTTTSKFETPGVGTIAACTSEDLDPTFADLNDKLHAGSLIHSTVSVKLGPSISWDTCISAYSTAGYIQVDDVRFIRIRYYHRASTEVMLSDIAVDVVDVKISDGGVKCSIRNTDVLTQPQLDKVLAVFATADLTWVNASQLRTTHYSPYGYYGRADSRYLVDKNLISRNIPVDRFRKIFDSGLIAQHLIFTTSVGGEYTDKP